jgi:hypothetical protein
MASPERRNIDWASAEIEGATLTVELTGASSKAWKQCFEIVLTLLDASHGRWGEVCVTKSGVQVADVQSGAEIEPRRPTDGRGLRARG